MTYEQFLNNKRHLAGEYGFDALFLPEFLFDFQKHIVTWALKKGRAALFVDTGLGKTAIQLVIAENIVRKTNQPVLILTPLAVAFQFIAESKKIGVDSVAYSKDGKITAAITITNYERLHLFSADKFAAIILDESSILKNFEGAIKNEVTEFCKKMKYRFLSTATPSPNDFIELGTSSEALGYLGYTDMLTRFFKNNEDTISPINRGAEWVLKSHAVVNFWQWVSGWSLSLRKPSDLGYNDEGFILPELKIFEHTVEGGRVRADGQLSAFHVPAHSFQDIRAETRATINDRCELAAKLAVQHETSVYWCNLNDEADLLGEIDKNAVQISGSMNIDKKEEILIAFSKGEIKKLITKPKITAFGLNWQHCNHTVFFPTYSYEQYYQSIRRFWRFGQKRDVICDLVLSDGHERVLQSLSAKMKKADEMFAKLNRNINGNYQIQKSQFNNSVEIPNFLRGNNNG